jgi:hypothetical protein
MGRQADIQGHAGTCAAFDWKGTNMSNTPNVIGPTALIAAMRCYVASKLGEEIEIPIELLT